MEFQKWLLQKYLDWQAEMGKPMTEVDYAEYLGVKQQSLSAWLRGYYQPKGYMAVMMLVAKYGDEVYTALGAEKQFPPELEGSMNRLAKFLQGLPDYTRMVVFEVMERLTKDKFWEDPKNFEIRFMTAMKEIQERNEKKLVEIEEELSELKSTD